jgi:DNA topoisomerase-1
VKKRLRAGRRLRVVTDPAEAARAAGLRYVSETGPGIRRRRAGRGFVYLNGHGPLRERATLGRIRTLAIPPSWTDVWICPSPVGHLQAVGRDARGRKQYRYHPRWRETRDETKFTHMVAFARALPRIRTRVAADLRRRGLPREKVLATVVRLLETTLARVNGDAVRFRFRGKGGKEHDLDVRDPRVARIVRRLQDLPGQELFQYIDDEGVRRSVDSGDVNAYLREISGDDFTAKDFRTWAGTVMCAVALAECRRVVSVRQARRNIARAIGQVAARLGNTPAIARKSYVHPALLEAYLAGVTLEVRPTRAAENIVRGFLARSRPGPVARAA